MKPRILLRTMRPPRVKKDCCLPLTALRIERNGPCLKFYRMDGVGRSPELWACLKFLSYESEFDVLLCVKSYTYTDFLGRIGFVLLHFYRSAIRGHLTG